MLTVPLKKELDQMMELNEKFRDQQSDYNSSSEDDKHQNHTSSESIR